MYLYFKNTKIPIRNLLFDKNTMDDLNKLCGEGCDLSYYEITTFCVKIQMVVS